MRETGKWDFGAIDQLLGEYSEAQSGCPITHSYTFDDVREKLLNDNDWLIEDLRKDHIFPYKIPEYIKHQYVIDDCWAKLSKEQFHQFEKEMGWHLLIRARRK